MLYGLYTLNAVLMVALPLLLGLWLERRLGQPWKLYGAGAATFVASQVVHLPLNAGLGELSARGLLPAPPEVWKLPAQAILLGLTAGLCEETARYVAYRWFLPRARTWPQAVMFGAGHGGIEAILLGLLAYVAFLQLGSLRTSDLGILGLPLEQMSLLQAQLDVYWSAPWYAALLGALERAFALCLHLTLAVLVLQAVQRRQPLWLAAAIAWHASANAAAVYILVRWGAYWAEAAVGLAAALSLGMLFALRGAYAPPPPKPSAAPETGAGSAPPARAAPRQPSVPEDEIRRMMDESKYSE